MSSFLGLAETIGRHGLFGAFYTDRGSHYFITPKDGGKVDKTQLTQVGRALSQLGITHIPSYSPQGARAHGTGVRDAAEAAAAGTAAGPDQDRGGRQPIPQGAVRARLQCPFRGAGGRARLGLRCPMSAGRSRTCSASRRIAWSAPTTASLGTDAACKFRLSAIAITMSVRPCACTNIPTAGSPSSTARAVLPASTEGRNRRCHASSRLTPLGGPSLWICGQRQALAHKLHRPSNNHRSGHLMCYKARTSSRATDRGVNGRLRRRA